MKSVLIITMLFFGMVNVFGYGNAEKTNENYSSEVTGGWNNFDKTNLNESVLAYVDNYLIENNSIIISDDINSTWSIERVWTQLVQGRRYLIAYNIMVNITNKDDQTVDIIRSSMGLLMIRRNFDGVITFEKDYKNSELLDFIGEFLTGEAIEKGGQL